LVGWLVIHLPGFFGFFWLFFLVSPLTGVQFALNTLASIGQLPSEETRLHAITLFLLVGVPLPGSAVFYDNLGSVDWADKPRLDPGQGARSDPSLYFTPGLVDNNCNLKIISFT
jgi:hypothetical protein